MGSRGYMEMNNSQLNDIQVSAGKREYRAPVLSRYGDIRDLTKAGVGTATIDNVTLQTKT